ncbi:MAG: 50S ribosomal protein L13 [Planctomycetes bacterium]|nr:50S ribosomal protein L13 [Planctomycetota bacterium]
MNVKTFVAKPKDITQEWLHIDGTDQVVGRLASRIAVILMGKHKPIYTPHLDTGDFVVVTNAEKVCFTGKKWTDKLYRHHTGWVGGLKEIPAEKIRRENPERILYFAVKRMLPKTKLGRQMLKKLKVYRGPEHPHAAQGPKTIDVSATRRS